MTSVVASADRYSVWVVGKDVVIMSKQRLIDCNEAIQVIKDLKGNCDHRFYDEALIDAQSELLALPTRNPFEWISVKNRLPENDYEKHWKDRNYYIVKLAPSGLMRVARYGYKNHNWWIDSHDCVMTAEHYTEVTHWMPLPDAPKGSDSNE